jgi:hypothetical protein
VQGEAVLLDLGLAVVLHDGQHAVDLQVGAIQVRPRLDEGAALQELLPAQTLAHQHVGQARAQLLQPLVGRIGGRQVLGRPRQADVEMILQVGADALGFLDHGDAVLLQQVRIADARQLQDLRRLHRAGAQQHLGVGMGRGVSPPLPTTYSTPMARPFSIRIFVVRASVTQVRFGLVRAAVR